MSRHNFLGHLALAITLIFLAAFAGQIRRWQNQPRPRIETRTELVPGTPYEQHSGSEVLVRFRPGTSFERVRNIALSLNDRIEDRIESVSGLTAIEDEDGLDPEAVAAQYRSMTELVDYAEPNYKITLEPDSSFYGNNSAPAELDRYVPSNGPND